MSILGICIGHPDPYISRFDRLARRISGKEKRLPWAQQVEFQKMYKLLLYHSLQDT